MANVANKLDDSRTYKNKCMQLKMEDRRNEKKGDRNKIDIKENKFIKVKRRR